MLRKTRASLSSVARGSEKARAVFIVATGGTGIATTRSPDEAKTALAPAARGTDRVTTRSQHETEQHLQQIKERLRQFTADFEAMWSDGEKEIRNVVDTWLHDKEESAVTTNKKMKKGQAEVVYTYAMEVRQTMEDVEAR